MTRARKLFPIYGSALANNMLTALGRGHLVDNFLSDYVDRHGRRAILGEPGRAQEVKEAIGREVVLAMVLEVREAMPNFYGKKEFAKLREEEKQTVELFFEELFGAFDRAWEWNADDRRAFRRDLGLYSDFHERNSPPVPQKPGKTTEQERPFVARVALLLDSSMIEQARRASRKFHDEVACLAQKLLTQTLNPDR